MKAYIKPGSKFTRDIQFIESHGDDVWEDICNTLPDAFRIRDAVLELKSLSKFVVTQRAVYLRTVLANVIEEGKATGYPTIRKEGTWYFWVEL